MKDVTTAKGLNDLRTATTARVHSKPVQKGTAHLDLYLFSNERQRLEKRLAGLEQRRKRLHQHLAEIQRAMAKIHQETEQERLSGEAGAPTAAPRQSPDLPEGPQRPWKKVALDYG